MSWKLVEKQRRILRDETGAVVKDPGGRRSVVLVYPNTYRVGMSNLAVHALYTLINARDDFRCERAFLPDAKDMMEHRRTRTPILTVESQRPIGEFDVIAFTVSFENDLTNIIPILELSGIPHRTDERTKGHSLIIAGGAAVTLNPAALADIVDEAIPGEFEAHIDTIMQALAECHPDRASLHEQVEGSPAVETITARDPCLSGRQASTELGEAQDDRFDLDAFPTETVIWTPHTEFGDMHLIEVMRGCSRGCAFCAVPGIYGPARFRSRGAVMRMIDEGSAHRNKFGLIGTDIIAHPHFTEIASAILERGMTFSLSSVRVDRITKDVAQLIARAGSRSISLGIEAATETLRSRLCKRLTDERCMAAIAHLAAAGITNVRLYFMIGLPHETDDDIDAIFSFAARARETIEQHAPRTRRTSSVECTITPFVPKPRSKFAKECFAGIARINGIQKTLKRRMGRDRSIRLAFDSAQQAAIEHYLATAGPEAIAFLEEAYRTSPRAALTSIT